MAKSVGNFKEVIVTYADNFLYFQKDGESVPSMFMFLENVKMKIEDENCFTLTEESSLRLVKIG